MGFWANFGAALKGRKYPFKIPAGHWQSRRLTVSESRNHPFRVMTEFPVQVLIFTPGEFKKYENGMDSEAHFSRKVARDEKFSVNLTSGFWYLILESDNKNETNGYIFM